MKSRLILALLIGALISAALLGADSITEGDWMDFQMPGISAAYVFWGAVSSSVFLGIAICWLVNAVVYSAPAFAIIMIFKFLAQALRSKKAA